MVERVNSLARKLGIGKPFPGDLGHDKGETVGVIQRVVFGSAIVETKDLYMCVKRFIAEKGIFAVGKEPQGLKPVVF
jgi:hypothetical protein